MDVPDTLIDIAFIQKDTKTLPDTHGWAYAEWALRKFRDHTFTPPIFHPGAPVRFRVPHQGVSAGLHLYSLSKTVKRGGGLRTGRRKDVGGHMGT